MKNHSLGWSIGSQLSQEMSYFLTFKFYTRRVPKSIRSTSIFLTQSYYIAWFIKSIEIVPIRFNSSFHFLKQFGQYLFGITHKAFVALLSLSFKQDFQFWKQSKFAGSNVRTVRRLTKLQNIALSQILLLLRYRWYISLKMLIKRSDWSIIIVFDLIKKKNK